jgi:hypothetical protein
MDVWVRFGGRVSVAVAVEGMVTVGRVWVAVLRNAVAVAMGVSVVFGVLVVVDNGASVGCWV